ncbi:Phosphatidylglycerophosphatase GEP4, mitochondrial [Pseudozyma hubeiensis]|nr:Phosphatidylglycerophosphatase GEP4, mitochondrial [Pseudozyma hubeiensis]
MGNLAGVVAILSVVFRPSLVVPHVQVPDIRHLDWELLHANGVRYLVFDKDNCLTAPHSDILEPSITTAWQQCQRVFGRENILIVSNSSGSSDDPSGLGAESLSRSLNVPVLCHKHKKPARGCAREALEYFVALSHDRDTTLAQAQHMPPGSASIEAGPSRESKKYVRERRKIISTQVPADGSGCGSVLLVGDRTMTDVVVAHRMNDELSRRRRRLGLDQQQSISEASTSIPPAQCISVLTTGIWTYEGRINATMRKLEARVTSYLIAKGFRPGQAGLLSLRKSAPIRQVDWQKIASAPFEEPKTLIASPAENSNARFAYTGDRLPPASPVEPTLGAILIATIVRPLPPAFASAFARILASKPVVWISSNLRDGWNVMIRGLEFGVREAGIQARSQDGRRITPLANEASLSTRSRLELDEIAPRRKADTRKEEVSATLASYLETRIPSLPATTLQPMTRAAQQLRNRLSSSTSHHFSAQSFLQRKPVSAPNTTTTVAPRSFSTSRMLHQQQIPPTTGAPKPRVPMRNWIAAFSALVIVPGSYYLGMRLHDLKDSKEIDPGVALPATPASASTIHDRHAAQDALLVRQAVADEAASRALAKARAERKRELELTLFHLVREREDVLDKLDRVHQRRTDSSQ